MLIFLHGGSGVGKSTLGKLLQRELLNSIIIDQDTYFMHVKPLIIFKDDNGNTHKVKNWDTTDAINFEEFNKQIDILLKEYIYVIVTGFALHFDKMQHTPAINILLDYNVSEEEIQINMMEARKISKKYSNEKSEQDKLIVVNVVYPYYKETMSKIGHPYKISVFLNNERRSKDLILKDILKYLRED